MYNIHSHYENILNYLNNIVTQPTVIYLYPFGATQPENIEALQNSGFGPIVIAYDQEPLHHHYNKNLFEFINTNFKNDDGRDRPIILLNTEKHSNEKNKILETFSYTDANYFFHGLAAADWYRGYRYNSELIDPSKRKITKKYITFNRITGNSRCYRSFFIAELIKNKLTDNANISYSEICPVHGHYRQNLFENSTKYNIDTLYVKETCSYLDTIVTPFRIDFKDVIHNDSQSIGPLSALQESFLHVVTETCYWGERTHLTEKIFKPIVAKQPFVLLGCRNNLKYLQSYGFKTFSNWWDESYDEIHNPIERLKKVVEIIKDIYSLPNKDLEAMLNGMNYILQYNYDLFFSKEFVDSIWNEMTDSLSSAISQL